MGDVNIFFESARDAWTPTALLVGSAVALTLTALWRTLAGRPSATAWAGVGGPVGLMALLLVRIVHGGPSRRRNVLAASVLAVILAVGAAAWWLSPSGQTLRVVCAWWWLVTAVGVLYGGLYNQLDPWRLATLTALRLVAVTIVAGLLFKPALRFPDASADALPTLTVLVDRSESMATADEVGGPTRYVRAVGALVGVADRLGESFDIRWLRFASDVEAVDGLAELRASRSGGESAGSTLLAAALGESAGGDGVLVLSDGIQTGEVDARSVAGRLATPIVTAAVGSADIRVESAGPNAELASIDAPAEALLDHRCTVAATIRTAGLADQVVRVTFSDGDRTLDEQVFIAGRSDASKEVPLTFTADDADRPKRRLTVRVAEIADETTLADNAGEIGLFVGSPQIDVLYVESIRPEFKFLSRQLRRDPNVRLVTMVRLGASKFVVNGDVDGRSLDRLPTDGEQWGLFDVVIVGDIDSSVWTPAQQTQIARFVRAGGGLIMLGGSNTLGPGGYGDTPVQDVLPVACGGRSIGAMTEPFIPQLTAAGEVSPVMADARQFMPGPDGREARVQLPPVSGCVRTGGLRGGASALAIAPGDGERIVLAVMPAGEGRAAVFTPFTTWRWHLSQAGQGDEGPYTRFWRQFVRHMADVDTPTDDIAPAVLGRLSRPCVRMGESVALEAHVRQASESAGVSVEIASADRPDAEPAVVGLSHEGQGRYEGQFTPPGAGEYVLSYRLDGAPEPDVLTLTVLDAGAEADRLARDDALLADLAEASGGESGDLADLPLLVDRLIARTRPPAEATGGTVRCYDFAWGMLLFIGLVTAEWICRRRWQLR